MPILGVIASSTQQGRGVVDTGAMFAIKSILVPDNGAASIDFTSIPATFTHLQLRFSIQTNRSGVTGDNMFIRFNGDSSSGLYSRHQLFGFGDAIPTSAAATSQNEIFIGSIPSSNVNYLYGISVLDINDYANTNKAKTTKTFTGYDANGSGAVALMGGAWYNTSAINRITIFPQSGTAFTRNSNITLYGIKGA
jgi:hypothetical protein